VVAKYTDRSLRAATTGPNHSRSLIEQNPITAPAYRSATAPLSDGVTDDRTRLWGE